MIDNGLGDALKQKYMQELYIYSNWDALLVTGCVLLCRSDQMVAYYSYSKKTLSWYEKIGFHIFEIMIHNGHKMFCMLKNEGDRKMALLQFRIAAVHHLLGENFPRESPTVQLQPDEVFHHLAPIPATGTKSKPTRKCRVCTKNLVRKETRYVCAGCPENYPLCVENCFKEYHAMN